MSIRFPLTSICEEVWYKFIVNFCCLPMVPSIFLLKTLYILSTCDPLLSSPSICSVVRMSLWTDRIWGLACFASS
jgi:hypothetical protein